MKIPNKPSIFAISAFAALGLITAMGFNSCSEVDFSKTTASGGESEQCVGSACPNPCVGAACPPPPELKNFEDDFTITPRAAKADILLVVDNSGSMKEDLLKMAEKLDGLIGVLDAGGIDWRMCYLTTDDVGSGQVLEWKTAAGSTGQTVLTTTTANKAEIFFNSMDNLPNTGTTGNEQGLIVIRNAVANPLNRDCFRNDSVLSVVLISDEDEKSCGGRCQTMTTSENPTGPQHWEASRYTNQYRALTDEDRPDNLIAYVESLRPELPFIVNAMVIRKSDVACYNTQDTQSPAFFGLTYQDLQGKTGGVLGNICADSYSTQLQQMGERTKTSLNSVTLQCAPVSAPAVTITPPPAGVTWTLTGNKILFSQPLLEGTVVNVKYTCAVPK